VWHAIRPDLWRTRPLAMKMPCPQYHRKVSRETRSLPRLCVSRETRITPSLLQSRNRQNRVSRETRNRRTSSTRLNCGEPHAAPRRIEKKGPRKSRKADSVPRMEECLRLAIGELTGGTRGVSTSPRRVAGASVARPVRLARDGHTQLLAAARYKELKPLRAGLVYARSEYLWSSAGAAVLTARRADRRPPQETPRCQTSRRVR
jgi:hypothetical protein